MTEETGWTSRIGVLDDGFAVMIGRVDGPGFVRFQSNLARRELPHCSAIGKAMLAQLTEESVLEIVRRPGFRRGHDHDHRRRGTCCASSRRAGTVGSRSTTRRTARASSASARVSRSPGNCVGAISLTGLKPTLPAGDIDGLGAVVRRYAASISGGLGAPRSH